MGDEFVSQIPKEDRCFDEGQAAADYNRRYAQRPGRGHLRKYCPYPPKTTEYLNWHAGYQYRSMVNDG